MKFLTKYPDSKILSEGLVYRANQTDNNRNLKNRLIEEQHNFCAYSEMYIAAHSVEVEHFDASLKGADNYYNYYAVMRALNQHKQAIDRIGRFQDAEFFHTLFFHDQEQFDKRIRLIERQYEAIDETDTDAKNLIVYLGLNSSFTSTFRSKHLQRLSNIFQDGNYSTDELKISFFRKHPEELSYITAIEIEFNLDLSEFYN